MKHPNRFHLILIITVLTALLSSARWTAAAPISTAQPDQPVLLAAPNPPSNLVGVEKADQKAVTLTWQASTGAVNYRIYRSRTQGTYSASELVTTVTTTTFTDTGSLKAFDDGAFYYYYVVTALDSLNNESRYSNEIEAVPHYKISWAGTLWTVGSDSGQYNHKTYYLGSPSPAAVTIYGEVLLPDRRAFNGIASDIWAQFGFAEKIGSPTSVDITQWTNWIDAEPFGVGMNEEDNSRFVQYIMPEKVGVFYYSYRFSTDLGRHWTYLNDTTVPIDPMEYPTIQLGFLDVRSGGDNELPTAPDITLTNVTTSSIRVNWSASVSTDIYAYDIYRTTVSSPVDTDWVRVNRTLHAAGTPTYLYNDTGLVSDTTYHYKLVALDTSFNAAPSTPQSEKTAPDPITFSINFTIPSFTPQSSVIHINLVSESSPNVLLGSVWNSTTGPGSCNFTTHQCTATLTRQNNETFHFRFSRGSQATIQTQLDGNTAAIDPSFVVTSSLTSVSRLVANWEDPLVISYSPIGSATFPWNNPTVTWNQAVLSSSTFSVLKLGFTVPGSFHFNAANQTLTFYPLGHLLGTTKYDISVTNVQDTHGVSQQIGVSWSFTTDKYRIYLPPGFRN
jgi:hypothetical protein